MAQQNSAAQNEAGWPAAIWLRQFLGRKFIRQRVAKAEGFAGVPAKPLDILRGERVSAYSSGHGYHPVAAGGRGTNSGRGVGERRRPVLLR